MLQFPQTLRLGMYFHLQVFINKMPKKVMNTQGCVWPGPGVGRRMEPGTPAGPTVGAQTPHNDL